MDIRREVPNNQITNDPSLTKIVRLLVWQGARGKESISHAVWPKAHYDALGYRTLRIWFRRSLRPFTPRHAFRGLSLPLPRDAWVSPDFSFNLPDLCTREKYTASVKSFRASYWAKPSWTLWKHWINRKDKCPMPTHDEIPNSSEENDPCSRTTK